ncbi:TrlF family AAA-like ATPase [Maribacter sp. CXY002]|uniref:TrlF family AAA-like ATPase n=1 Tax=Maribacter luteocoastalis TaxID=3407671 RepID=UPI003B672CE0
MSKNYPKGSEWRIWDLHIHTPGTKKNDQFTGANLEEKWDNYVTSINNSTQQISVLGITDYFSIENYFKFKKLQTDGTITKQFDLILPNIELRVLPVTGSATPINLHCIFNNSIDSEIETRFLAKLKFTNSNSSYSATKQELIRFGRDHSNYQTLDEETAYKKGVEQFVITLDSLDSIFKNDRKLKENTIIVASNKSTDGVTGIVKHEDFFINKNESQLDATRQSLYQFSDTIFSSNEGDRNYFTGKSVDDEQTVIRKCGSLKPCFHGCDAHSNDKIFNPDDNRYCWIKADPTFDGLIQILYEPEERIRISDKNPVLEFDKPYISNIKFKNNLSVFEDEDDLNFQQNEGIPLNQNLVTIIGGRGEGKSMLTDYVASSFIGQEHSKEGVFNKNGEVNLSYHKSNQSEDDIINFDLTEDKKAVEFIYINQGRLKTLVEKKDKQFQLANSIRKLAKLKEPEFNKELDKQILDALEEFHELNRFFSIKDEDGNFIYSIKYLESQEKAINDFISNITTSENKDKLEKYSENLRNRNNLNSKLKELNELEISLNNSIEKLNQEISKVNGEASKISLIELSALKKQFDEIIAWKSELQKEVETISVIISAVKEEFKDYKGDLTTLLNDIDKFQKNLSQIREDIAISKSKKEQLAILKKKIYFSDPGHISLIDKIKSDYESQVSELLKNWEDFKDVDSKERLNPSQKAIMKNLLTDLEIEVKIDFDIEKFYSLIYHSIDGAKWRIKGNIEAQKSAFEITDLDSFYDFLRTKYQDFYESDNIHSKILKDIFFKESERKQYLKVFPILKYKEKDLNKISVGQKGTVYLKMMLATEAFSKPIIFDQPEDDLDNEFIMQNLISLFKELKQYRQVIIVTHNANLVVNADAEQVIVASNVDGILNYISGSLENQLINSKICQILEGGELAFEKRRRKYQQIQ